MRTVHSLEQASAAFESSALPVTCAWKESTRQQCNSLADAEQFYAYMAAGPSNTNEIFQFIQCGKCMNTLPHGVSPREYGRLEVGFTAHGLQVWCRRCEANVVHIDFEGQKHPANCTAARPPRTGEATVTE